MDTEGRVKTCCKFQVRTGDIPAWEPRLRWVAEPKSSWDGGQEEAVLPKEARMDLEWCLTSVLRRLIRCDSLHRKSQEARFLLHLK